MAVFLFAIVQKKWRYPLNPYSYGVSWTSEKKYFCNIMAAVGHTLLLQQNAKWLNCEVWKLIFCHLNIECTCNYHHFKLLVSFLGSKTKILQPLLYFSENIQRGDPWKNIFLVFFLMHYFHLWDHRRLLECHFGVLECWKPQNEPISKSS